MMPILLASAQLFGDGNWLDTAKSVDPNAVQWVTEQLKEDAQLKELMAKGKVSFPVDGKKCLTTFDVVDSEAETPVYVLISFSVPEASWVGLSKEMEKTGAVFVLRGLPGNSFKELSKKIQSLNALGVMAQIQINPTLFTKYQVDKVPTFLIENQGDHYKIAGNISLSYALQKVSDGNR